MKRNFLLFSTFIFVCLLSPLPTVAECTFVSGGSATPTISEGEIYVSPAFNNNARISKIEFKYKKEPRYLGVSAIKLEYLWDRKWISYGDEISISNSEQSKSISISISENISKTTQLRLVTVGSTSGSYKYYISNFTVYVQSSFEASPKILDFGSVPTGSKVDTTVTLTYSNIGSSLTTEGISTPYSISIPSFDDCPAGGSGTITATITYAPTLSSTNDEQEITISTSNGLSEKIALIGIASEIVDPMHTWNGNAIYYVGDPAIDLSTIWKSNSEGTTHYSIKSFTADNDGEIGATAPAISGTTLTLGQAGTLTIRMMQEASSGYNAKTSDQTITITKYDLSATISQTSATWDATITNPFSVTYSLADYVVQSLDPTIATYADGAIQTYAETGTARFLISRPEDYKYNQLAETLSINVAKRVENCTYEQLGIVEVKRSSYDYVLPYACNKISVQFSKQSGGVGGDITLKGYASDGTWVQDICSLSRSNLSSSAYLYDIDTRIREIQFYADGAGNS